MKRWIPVSAAIVLAATIAVGGSIKVWSNGDWVLASDLNANFQHIHDTMVGGHGARLMNSDVSASAAITHSKLATPGLVPKAAFTIGSGSTACGTSTTCTTVGDSGLGKTVTSTGTAGTYVVTWSVARGNANYTVLVTTLYAASPVVCTLAGGTATVGFTVACFASTTGTATAAVVSVVMLDDTP